MKTIIVPIDFSPLSFNGLNLAITFANKLRSDIKLLHIEKDIPEHEVKQNFEDLIAKYESQLVYGKFSYRIRKGKIYKEITNQAKYDDPAMIICSTHGASGFEEFFIGSNAYKMVSSADCPVITIRKGACPTRISKIILPVDRTLYTRQKVPIAAEIAQAFKAEVHILGVADSFPEESEKVIQPYIKQIEKYMDERKVKYTSTFIAGDNIANIIVDYGKTVKAQLICIMTEQETTLSNILLGSYAQQMVNHSPIPILSVRPKEKFFQDSFTTFGPPV